MLGRSVGMVGFSAVLATLGLGAAAFIIPPGVAPAAGPENADLSISVVNPKSQTVAIPCSSCAFPTTKSTQVEGEQQGENDDDDSLWIQGGAKDLLLKFTISDDGQHLQLGGEDIWPGFGLHREPVYVMQISRDATTEDVRAGVNSARLEVTAYGVSDNLRETLSEHGDELVTLSIQIFGLENEFLHPGSVEAKLLCLGTGELLIMKLTSLEASAEDLPIPPTLGRTDGPENFDFPLLRPLFRHGDPHGPHGLGRGNNNKECEVLPGPLCKVKLMLESKIDAVVRPPHRGHGGPHSKFPFAALPGSPFMREGMEGPPHPSPPPPHHGRPHHRRPHGPHHHRPGGHHRHGHFWPHHALHAFAKGLAALLIPVCAGVTAGMAVGILGLILGRMISSLWMRLARGGRRRTPPEGTLATSVFKIEDGENVAILAEMEALPVYEDLPRYEGMSTSAHEVKEVKR